MEQPTYTQEAVDQLMAKFREVEMICLKHRIPCFMTFALEHDGETEYPHMTITPHLVETKLTDNKIDKFNAALNSNITLTLNTHAPSEYIGDAFDELAGMVDDEE